MSNAVQWTPEAEARLQEIPFFVRPAAHKKIEKFAQDAGIAQITVEVYFLALLLALAGFHGKGITMFYFWAEK